MINGHALLYTWTGSDPALKPLLLLSHQDVVPVEAASAGAWHQPGFSGAIADGFVWGRGAWDNKSNLMSQLEAVETLLAAGFTPRRTVYIAAGADEEVGGLRGARAIALLLRQRGVRLDFVIDEGLVVTEGMVPGVAAPVGLIGVVQKGYLTLELAVHQAQSGHAAMPPRESVIAILAAGLERLQAHPFPARLAGVPRRMLERLAPEMPWTSRVAMANLWLFRPLVERQLAATDAGRAQLQTTAAITLVRGGEKENVLPSHAEALVNFRTLPGEGADSVITHVREVLGDARIEVNKMPGALEASRTASVDAPAYKTIEQTIREVFPGSAVSPGLLNAHADGGYFDDIADNVYLFSPVRMRPEDAGRFHGVDERIAVKNYLEMINFYYRLVSNAAS